MKIFTKFFYVAILACVVVLSFYTSVASPVALVLGFLFTCLFGNPYGKYMGKLTKYLLQVSVVGLGFGMNVHSALSAGKEGFWITVTSIVLVIGLGYFIGKRLKMPRKLSHLVASGTAICGGSAIAVLILLPLLFAAFTGFKKNPYKALYRSLPAAIAGLSAMNGVSIIPIEEGISRYSLGVQKRISSVSIPLLSVIGKGGSAFVSAIAMISLFEATTGTMPELSVMLIAAAAAALVSLISSAAIGTEAIFIIVLSLRILGINLYGAENAVLALLPLIGGIGAMIDALIATLGSNIAAVFVDTDIDVPYKDTL